MSIEVWPENWPIFQVFCRLQTQWLTNHAGPTGLNYQSAYPLLDRIASDPTEWDELLGDLQAMEIAALNQMREDNA